MWSTELSILTYSHIFYYISLVKFLKSDLKGNIIKGNKKQSIKTESVILAKNSWGAHFLLLLFFNKLRDLD
jgi:hypothetical protein